VDQVFAMLRVVRLQNYLRESGEHGRKVVRRREAKVEVSRREGSA
jgi:hypothetical protein